jgi:hypothetical protein
MPAWPASARCGSLQEEGIDRSRHASATAEGTSVNDGRYWARTSDPQLVEAWWALVPVRVTDEPILAALKAHAARKVERDRALVEALVAPTPDAGSSPARERLEQLLDRETLASLDERMLALVTGGTEVTPEPLPFLDAVDAAQVAQRHALLNAVLGH